MVALDYTSRIAPAALKAAGASDVCRYLCYVRNDTVWKIITQHEYDELMAAGVGVTLNWELAANDWARGEATGTAHGIEAVKQAHDLGYPAGCTIIGSADFDMTRAIWDNAGHWYCRGFANAIRAGGYVPGVYGPWDVLTWVRDSGLMGVFWQAGMSFSWSERRNRNLWPGAHLYQSHHVTVAGQDCDSNDIHITPWGQARSGAPALDTGDDMGRQMLVADADGVVWLVDGLTRNRADPVGAGNGQAHQEALLGNLGNGGKIAKFGTPAAGMGVWGVDVGGRLDAIEARMTTFEAADAARDRATAAAVAAMADMLNAAGGSVDAAAVIAHIDAATAKESTIMADVLARLQAEQRESADLRARLAAALSG